MDEIPPAEFESAHFDAKKVVQHYRKLVPLPQLQKSLRHQQASARQDLIELINEKYADFVSLSSRMQGVEKALKPLKAPLEESNNLTKEMQTKLNQILDQAATTQKELASVRARKDALAAYIENTKLFARAKETFAHRWGNHQESEDSLREYVAQENVARDLRRIRLNLGGSASPSSDATQEASSAPQDDAAARKLESLPESQVLLQEASDFEKDFSEKLRERLKSLLLSAQALWEDQTAAETGSNRPSRQELLAIAHLSRALVTLGRGSWAEETFSEVFAQGALETATTACTGTSQRKGDAPATFASGALAVDLAPFFASVCRDLLAADTPIIWFANIFKNGIEGALTTESDELEDSLLSVPSLNLITNSVAAPALRHLQQVWEKSVFMPAFPDIFAANYLQSAKFIEAVEATLNPTEKAIFSKSSVLSDFRKRWKTQVYFSLRQKEATKILQVAVTKGISPANSSENRFGNGLEGGSGGPFWLEVTSETMRVMQLLWSERWFLEVLYPKTLQLILELLGKYGKVIAKTASAVLEQQESLSTSSGWDGSAAWTNTSLPVKMARIASDVAAVVDTFGKEGGYLRTIVLGKLPRAAEEAVVAGKRPPSEVVAALLDESSVDLKSTLRSLGAVVQKAVAAAVGPQFAAIRGIPALYRMLNKPVPTNPSPYVESAMRPILTLRTAASAAPAELVQTWTLEAIDQAAAEFCIQAAQLLESTKQQEASLRRLSARTSGGGGSGEATDLEKIHVQLWLDVEAFKKATFDVGATAEGSPNLSKLLAIVSPFEEIVKAHSG
mmetsp:Transcript_95616/g.209106  ORF Transcript_95616/g.209106 Transcript_95616/m.209106 type:complete len:793 (-) Transcript_95616:28-2406(-)